MYIALPIVPCKHVGPSFACFSVRRHALAEVQRTIYDSYILPSFSHDLETSNYTIIAPQS